MALAWSSRSIFAVPWPTKSSRCASNRDDRERVPADPGDGIVPRDPRFEPSGHLPEQAVPDGMAESIVSFFKMIEVET